jgi:sensor domain CHASE-containing protein
MHFRNKIILTFVFAFLLFFVSSDYFARRFVFDRLKTIERDSALSDMGRILYFVNDAFNGFDEIVRDYAARDDTYKFMADRNPAYLRSTLIAQTFDNINVDAVVYSDASGRIVYSSGRDKSSGKLFPLSAAEEKLMLDGFAGGQLAGGKHGLVQLPGGVMQVDARPIIKSGAAGPGRGVLMMGRYFNAHELVRLVSITHLLTTAFPLNQPELPPEISKLLPALRQVPLAIDNSRKENILGYLLMTDVFGKPALVLRAEIPNDLIFQTQIFYSLLTLIRLGAFFLAALAALLILQMVVVRPVSQANKTLKEVLKKRGLAIARPGQGADELAELAAAARSLLNEAERPRP